MDFILKEVEKYGYKAGFANLECLDSMKQDIEKLFQTGKINERLYQRYLGHFSFDRPDEMPDAESLITVAFPKPTLIAEFSYKNRIIPVTIPHIYKDYNKAYVNISELLSSVSFGRGHRFIKANIPEKLLASKNGMAAYGRNNISYIQGLGSLYQLTSFFTNIKLHNVELHEPKILERCNNCEACFKVCPTHAITKERFLINAERCLTFINENPGEFPAWINPGFHNSLIGCMMCQKFCPENKKAINQIEKSVHFSDDETNCILKSNHAKELPEIALKKIEDLDLLETHFGFNEFKRNLLALLERKEED